MVKDERSPNKIKTESANFWLDHVFQVGLYQYGIKYFIVFKLSIQQSALSYVMSSRNNKNNAILKLCAHKQKEDNKQLP